jgi:hypothetical protein
LVKHEAFKPLRWRLIVGAKRKRGLSFMALALIKRKRVGQAKQDAAGEIRSSARPSDLNNLRR